MAITACCPEPKPVLTAPTLPEERASCAAFPEIREVLQEQPSHVFLSGSNGEAVVTDGQYRWVRFDIANKREARLIEFGDVRARSAHFECFDDLEWSIGVIRDLQAED